MDATGDEIEWLESGPQPGSGRDEPAGPPGHGAGRRRHAASQGDGITWVGPLSGPPPPKPNTRLNVAALSAKDRDWHRSLVTRVKPQKVRWKTGHLLGLNLCAAAMFGYFRYLLSASRGSPVEVGLLVVASLVLVVSMIAGAIVLNRLSSSYRRRSENRDGRAAQALEVASIAALGGSVLLVALLILLGLGFAVLVFNAIVEGR
ncbi:hypothetical protein TA3x_000851 [Tundrisphaera sp. TA3]|uniref:hypothetical protein n=1 Tax=Tundrisphaera sp. TA3 TaxID=3435775 RepID=UPI003EBC8CAA